MLEVVAEGTVGALARWPVKSMSGETIDVARVSPEGIHGDRRFTVRSRAEPERALTADRFPQLLGWTATGAPEPTLRDPDGRRWRCDDRGAWRALSDDLGRAVELRRHARGVQYMRNSVLLTVDASLRQLEHELGRPLGIERFRSNLHLHLDCDPFAEHHWTGHVLQAGNASFELLHPCERCVIAARDPHTGKKAPDLLRHLHREHDLLFGILAAPLNSAPLEVGQHVRVFARNAHARRDGASVLDVGTRPRVA